MLILCDGWIEVVNVEVFEGVELIDCDGKCFVFGLVDWGVKIGELGECYKESICSVGLVVVVGGVMMIIVWFDMLFFIDNFEVLEFVSCCV